ncbi:dTDP-4-dehydrorhamnose reductase [Haloechinothrix halophila]|uniref:dTDP-4-dehydrorhamnose reductase n=1 Tax=Haloechinothrix halophila TaxID=1069073 RepID=UPI00040D78C1|nr:dTDP-4-dehydrorhamnose reductase [Haloechinothrix halophila]
MALALLVPGGSGQLGGDIARRASEAGAVVRAPGSGDLDVTQAGQVIAAVRELAALAKDEGHQPMVINAAAYTAVDDAETDEQRAFAVNADGPRGLAAACATTKVPLVHLSTDYVFSGETDRPYEPDDALSPRSAYGRTKAAGEAAVLASGARAWVVRTAWVYGAGGKNFVNTMMRLEAERDTLSVVNDQHGSPTWTSDLADGLLELAGAIVDGRAPEPQALHCTGGGETTWYGLARAVFEELGADPERVQPCTTAEFPRPAARPAYGVLSNASWRAAGLTPLRDWREGLTAFMAAQRAEV